MFRVFGFLTKKDGLSIQEFIDYYEKGHVPLICSLAPVPTVYKRRYLKSERLTTEGGDVDFDVMTEPYIGAVQSAFGTNVDFATITKQYVGDSNLPDAAHRYSPGHVAGAERTVIRGRPNPENISTSYVESFNLRHSHGVSPVHAVNERV
jgi:hypothetical protein